MYNSNRYHIMLTRTPERRRMQFLVNPCEPMPCQPMQTPLEGCFLLSQIDNRNKQALPRRKEEDAPCLTLMVTVATTMSSQPRLAPSTLKPSRPCCSRYFLENEPQQVLASRPARESALPSMDALQAFFAACTSSPILLRFVLRRFLYPGHGLGARDLPLKCFHPAGLNPPLSLSGE